MEYYSAIKKEQAADTTWMTLKIILLNEGSQTKKTGRTDYCMIYRKSQKTQAHLKGSEAGWRWEDRRHDTLSVGGAVGPPGGVKKILGLRDHRGKSTPDTCRSQKTGMKRLSW